jgi:hypothetical protein
LNRAGWAIGHLPSAAVANIERLRDDDGARETTAQRRILAMPARCV